MSKTAWFRGHEVNVLAETDDGDCIVEFVNYCCDCSSDYGVDHIRIITGKSELSETNQLDEISKEINTKRKELEAFDGALERKKRIEEIAELDDLIERKRRVLHAIAGEIKAVGATLNLPKDYDIEDLECVRRSSQ